MRLLERGFRQIDWHPLGPLPHLRILFLHLLFLLVFIFSRLSLSFLNQIGTIPVVVITKGYDNVIKYIKQLSSGAKGCLLARQRWLGFKASSLLSPVADWGKSAGQTGVTVSDLHQQRSGVNPLGATRDSVTDLELVPWLLYASSYLLQCLTV